MANQSTLAPTRHSARERRPTARAAESAAQNAPTGQRRQRTSSEDDTGSEHEDVDTPPAPTAPLSRLESFNLRYKVADRSNEDVLTKQVAKWTSAAYTHFKMPPTIVVKSDGSVVYHFYCLTHPSEYVSRARHDETTSNLVRHCARCARSTDAPEAVALSHYVHGSSYDKARHRVDICLWVCRRRRPYAIVEDPELVTIFKNLHAPVDSPSASTVSRDVKEIFGYTRDNIIEILANVEGKIHLTADGWTSPNTIAFLGVTIQFVRDGQIVTFPLDFVKLTKAHTGRYLAMRLTQCIQDFRIGNKLMSFTGDNGSNNDTMVDELSVLLPAFRGASHRARCIGHVLNLVAKALLSPFARKGGDKDLDMVIDGLEDDEDLPIPEHDDDDDDTMDGDEVAPEVEASDSAVVDAVMAEADLDGRLEPLTAKDAGAGCLMLTKLRRLARSIANSPTLLDGLYEACDWADIPRQKIKKDVSTRWNSTSELARSGRMLRPALDRMVLMAEYNKPGGVRLRRCHMSDAEWMILSDLDPLLNALSYATKKVSQSATPLIHSVIPVIDSLTAYFDKGIDDITLHPAVRHAALRGVLMLNKYYAKTDESVVYRIAMILHPEFKLDYFKKAKWLPEWIAEARRVITSEWVAHYKSATPVPPSSLADTPSSPRNDRYADVRDIFETHLQASSSEGDALEEWLSLPTVPLNGKMDAIGYWAREKATGHPLAQMALDYLSIPAASTDIERAFSRGGLTVSKLRHSLSDSSTRGATVLGAWHEVPGLIPYDLVVSKMKEKSKRPKKRARLEPQSTEIIEVQSS